MEGGLYTHCSLLSAALDQHFSILATYWNHLAKVPMPGSTPRDDHLIVLGCCWDHGIFLKTLLVVLICSKGLEPLASFI